MRILIADDHAMPREGLGLILATQPSMEVVGVAADGQEAFKLSRELSPDLVIMDILMPGSDGAQATERIRACCPGVKVLVLSAYQDPEHVRQLLAAGASGYVLKSAMSQELIRAIHAVMGDGFYLDPSLAIHVVNGFINLDGSEGVGTILSPREMEVATLTAWGHTNREMAQRMHLSVKTIEGHRAEVMRKLKFTSRAEITLYALRQGWMKDE